MEHLIVVINIARPVSKEDYVIRITKGLALEIITQPIQRKNPKLYMLHVIVVKSAL